MSLEAHKEENSKKVKSLPSQGSRSRERDPGTRTVAAGWFPQKAEIRKNLHVGRTPKRGEIAKIYRALLKGNRQTSTPKPASIVLSLAADKRDRRARIATSISQKEITTERNDGEKDLGA